MSACTFEKASQERHTLHPARTRHLQRVSDRVTICTSGFSSRGPRSPSLSSALSPCPPVKTFVRQFLYQHVLFCTRTCMHVLVVRFCTRTCICTSTFCTRTSVYTSGVRFRSTLAILVRGGRGWEGGRGRGGGEGRRGGREEGGTGGRRRGGLRGGRRGGGELVSMSAMETTERPLLLHTRCVKRHTRQKLTLTPHVQATRFQIACQFARHLLYQRVLFIPGLL